MATALGLLDLAAVAGVVWCGFRFWRELRS